MSQKRSRRFRTAGWFALAAGALLLAGCGENSVMTTGTTSYDEAPEMAIDLAAEDGGLTTGDEGPGFRDDYYASYLGEDEPVADPLEGDPNLERLERHAASVQYLRVTWGNLQRGPDADDGEGSGPLMDWTGKATVSDGLLLPLRLIRFERGDYLIRPGFDPEVDRQTVKWVSYTTVARDGILFKIIVPSARDTTLSSLRADNPNDGLTDDDMFVFDTGPLTVRFPLTAIAGLDSTIMVDEVNGVTFTGFDAADIHPCPRGPVVGAWVRVEGDSLNGGFFRAKWMGALGGLAGHVSGRWGVLADGSRVWKGKVITPAGRYMGHVRGTWTVHEDDPDRGDLRGIWEARRPEGEPLHKGFMKGHWTVSDRVDEGGLFRGVWGHACGQPAEDTGDDGGV